MPRKPTVQVLRDQSGQFAGSIVVDRPSPARAAELDGCDDETRASAKLRDRGWLTDQIATRSVDDIAAELGVSSRWVSAKLRELRIGRVAAGVPSALDDPEFLREALACGNTVERLAAAYRRDVAVVEARAAELGRVRRRRFINLHDWRHPALYDEEWMRDRYVTAGWGYRKIAACLGAPPSSVIDAVKRLGLHDPCVAAGRDASTARHRQGVVRRRRTA